MLFHFIFIISVLSFVDPFFKTEVGMKTSNTANIIISFCEAGHVSKTTSCDTSCSAGTFSPGGQVTECQSCGVYKECVKESVEFDDTDKKVTGWYKCPYYIDKKTNGGC